LVPSDRVMVPRSLAFAPPAAVAVPVVVTGGQAPAHAPEHADVSPVSLTHRYTARPELVVRNVPAADEAVVMTVAPDALAPLAAGLLAAALLAGPAAAVLLLPLLQAAARRATPTAPPIPVASLAGADIRLTVRFLMVFFVSRLARSSGPLPLRRMTVATTTGRDALRDWMAAANKV
jgi:hypothetical protein